jgi:hypothetical protein
MLNKLLITSIFLFLYTITLSAQNFESIYQAERFVMGSWKSMGTKSNQAVSIQMSQDMIGSKVTFYRGGTFRKQLGKLYDNKVIEGTWEVKPDENGNYYLEERQGKGMFVMIVTYNFEGRDYLIDNFGVRFRRD